MLNAERSPNETDRDLVRLVETVPGLSWAADADGRILHLSAKFQDYVGGLLSGGDLAPTNHFIWNYALGEEEQTALGSAWADAASGPSAFQATHRVSCASGLRWMRSAAQPQTDLAGRPVFWLGTSIDIDDTMSAIEQSRQSGNWMKALIDTVPAPVWSTDARGEPTYVNRALAIQTGININDLEGGDSSVLATAIASAIHPDDMDMVGAALGRSFTTGEPFRLKYRQRRADGHYGWIRGEAEPLRDADGNIVQWFGVCYDIDNEVKAQDSLRSAHEALTKAAQFAGMAELSASIAHDVSQPLASMVTSSDACLTWLGRKPPNYDRALRSAQNAYRDAHAAAEIFTRIRALFQRTGPQKRQEDLNRIVPEACELLAREMSSLGVKVAQSLWPDLPPVFVDAVQIQQVIVNLIRNAAEAMWENGVEDKQVVIRTRLAGTDVVVEVEDTGPGIADNDKMFQPFVTTKSSGMGMGLSISRSMIHSHGGRLWAENIESGAKFAFALELNEPGAG